LLGLGKRTTSVHYIKAAAATFRLVLEERQGCSVLGLRRS